MSFSWSIKSSSFNFYWPYSTIYASNRPPWRRYYAVGLRKNPCFIFVQRACLNILPTRDNLHRRKLKVEPRCEFCCQQPKNVSHVLWECLSLEMFGQWSEGLRTPIGFFLFLFIYIFFLIVSAEINKLDLPESLRFGRSSLGLYGTLVTSSILKKFIYNRMPSNSTSQKHKKKT